MIKKRKSKIQIIKYVHKKKLGKKIVKKPIKKRRNIRKKNQ